MTQDVQLVLISPEDFDRNYAVFLGEPFSTKE